MCLGIHLVFAHHVLTGVTHASFQHFCSDAGFYALLDITIMHIKMLVNAKLFKLLLHLGLGLVRLLVKLPLLVGMDRVAKAIDHIKRRKPRVTLPSQTIGCRCIKLIIHLACTRPAAI